MVENGRSVHDAEEEASVLEALKDDYYIGSDMAQLQLTGNIDTSHAIAVCVDVRDPGRPRVLVTEWYLLLTNVTLQRFITAFRREYGVSPEMASTTREIALSTRAVHRLVCQSQKDVLTALVLCHTRPIPSYDLKDDPPNPTDDDYSRRGHFSIHWFVAMAQRYFPQKEQIAFETVDILSGQKGPTPVHHRADAWSTAFAMAHSNQYPLVFMPDCGGPWFEVQKAMSGTPAVDALISVALVMVAPSGYLCVSKLLAPWMVTYLEKKFYVVFSGTVDHWDTEFLVIQKTES